MNSPLSILFITHTQIEMQGQYLLRTLAEFGRTTVSNAEQAAALYDERRFDLTVLDAGCVDDPAELTARLRARAPSAAIIVVTVSPTWKRARAVLQAGALDYVKISLDPNDLRRTIGGIIERLT